MTRRLVVIMVFGLLRFWLLYTHTPGSKIVCDFVVVIDNMSWCAVVFVCGGDNHDEYC